MVAVYQAAVPYTAPVVLVELLRVRRGGVGPHDASAQAQGLVDLEVEHAQEEERDQAYEIVRGWVSEGTNFWML